MIWKPVVGYEGAYEVSDHGDVRSLDREIVASGGIVRRLTGRHLKPGLSDGYLSIALLRGGNQTSWRIHRLVAAAFLGPRPKGRDVCHKNDIRTDNVLGNLRYGSRSENTQDACRNGHKRKYYSKYTGVSKATRCESRPFRASVTTGTECQTVHIGNYETELEAAKARNAYIVKHKLNDRALCTI